MALIVSKDLKIAHEDFFGDLEYLLESKYGTIRTNEEGRVYRTFEPLLRCKVRNRVRSMIKDQRGIYSEQTCSVISIVHSETRNKVVIKLPLKRSLPVVIEPHYRHNLIYSLRYGRESFFFSDASFEIPSRKELSNFSKKIFSLLETSSGFVEGSKREKVLVPNDEFFIAKITDSSNPKPYKNIVTITYEDNGKNTQRDIEFKNIVNNGNNGPGNYVVFNKLTNKELVYFITKEEFHQYFTFFESK